MPIMQENIYLSTTILQSLVALPPQSSLKLAKCCRTNITVTMSFQRFSRLAVHLTKQFYPWRYSFQSLYSITIALSGNESIMRPPFLQLSVSVVCKSWQSYTREHLFRRSISIQFVSGISISFALPRYHHPTQTPVMARKCSRLIPGFLVMASQIFISPFISPTSGFISPFAGQSVTLNSVRLL